MVTRLEVTLIASMAAASPVFAQTAPEVAVGPVIGYDFGSKAVLIGANGRLPLGGSSRFHPEVVAELGGERRTLLLNFESQRVFNREGSLPFFIGASYGYLFQRDDDRTVADIVAGVDRPMTNRGVLFLKVQWILVRGSGDSFRLVSGLLFGR